MQAPSMFNAIVRASLANRLFCLAAVLGWISPFRPERSSSFSASRYAAAVALGSPPLRTFFTAVRRALRWARLRVVRLLDCRMAFLADLVLGTAFLAVGGWQGAGGMPVPEKAKYSRGNTLPQDTRLTHRVCSG